MDPRLSTVRLRVRGYHLDGYGHVNNARYLEFLEEGRWGYFDDRPALARRLTRGDVAFVVWACHSAFTGTLTSPMVSCSMRNSCSVMDNHLYVSVVRTWETGPAGCNYCEGRRGESPHSMAEKSGLGGRILGVVDHGVLLQLRQLVTRSGRCRTWNA